MRIFAKLTDFGIRAMADGLECHTWLDISLVMWVDVSFFNLLVFWLDVLIWSG